MIMPAPGSTVYVHWYGKALQGEVVPDDHRIPLFSSMVHVRVPVQGTHIVAVFTPSHVYATSDCIPASVAPSTAISQEEDIVSCVPPQDDVSTRVVCKTPSLREARQRYIDFKAAHWDQVRNHVKVEALDDLYTLWRTCIALKLGKQVHMPQLEQLTVSKRFEVAVDLGVTGGDRGVISVVDTEAGRILQESSSRHMQPMPKPSADIPKPTKKQLRSTGRIQFRETIQTSLFD